MRFRSTLIAAMLALGLGAFLYFYEIRGGKRREEAEEFAKKLFHFEEADVQKITLVRNDTTRIVLEKGKDGLWHIAEPIETDADQDAVGRLMDTMKDASCERVVADSASDLGKFGLEHPKVKVALTLKDTTTDTLCVGDFSPTGSYVFAMWAGKPQVFLSKRYVRTRLDQGPFDLRERRVLPFPKEEAKKIVLKYDGKKFVLTGSGDEWEIEEPGKFRADASTVRSFLSRLRTERARKFVLEHPSEEDLRKYGIDEPSLEVTVWLGEEKAQKTLRVGKLEDWRYYAKDMSREPIFMVDSSFVAYLRKDLMNLRDKHVVRFDRDKVDRIELAYGDSVVVCEKDTSSGDWYLKEPKEGKMKSWRANRLLSDIKFLRAREFLGKHEDLRPYGLDSPRIVARLLHGKELLAELKVGKYKGDKVYVLGQEVCLADSSIVGDLLPSLDELLEEGK